MAAVRLIKSIGHTTPHRINVVCLQAKAERARTDARGLCQADGEGDKAPKNQRFRDVFAGKQEPPKNERFRAVFAGESWTRREGRPRTMPGRWGGLREQFCGMYS